LNLLLFIDWHAACYGQANRLVKVLEETEPMDASPTEACFQQRYVRVTSVRDKRFVEFDFSIGDPTLFVELVLPFEQFQLFCKRNQVLELSAEQAAQVDYDQLKWRYGKPDVGA
jgi:phenol hydroxylase P0 protein